MANVTFDASSESVGSGATSASHTHTCGGSDRILFAHLETQNTITNVSMTYNGVAMTLLESYESGTVVSYVYYLVNPASGANTLAASWTTSRNYNFRGFSAKDVNQNDPMGATNTANGTSDALTVDVTSLVGQLVVDFTTASAGTGWTAGAGQTAVGDITAVWSANSYEAASAPTTTMSWATSGVVTYHMLGVPLKPYSQSGFFLFL